LPRGRSRKREKRRRKRRLREVNKWRERRDVITLVIAAKSKLCMDCGFPEPGTYDVFPHWVMDFDHRPGTRKRGNVSAMARDPRFSITQIVNEMAKCDVVCSNCHRDRTYRRQVKYE
jgi:hypothetical protein